MFKHAGWLIARGSAARRSVRRWRKRRRRRAPGPRRSRCRPRATRWRSPPSAARSTWSAAASAATPCRWSTNTIRRPTHGGPARRCRRGSITWASPCSNGKIITVGGFIGSVHRGAVNEVYQYDPAADQWRALAPLKRAARLGRRDRARWQGPRHRRPRRRQHVHRRHPRGLRSRDRQVVRARAGAEGARSLRRRRDRGQNPRHRRPRHQPGQPGRRARRLRSEDQHLVGRPAAADRAQRARLRALPGHDRGAGRRAAARHVCRKTRPTIRSRCAGGRSPQCRAAVTAPARR